MTCWYTRSLRYCWGVQVESRVLAEMRTTGAKPSTASWRTPSQRVVRVEPLGNEHRECRALPSNTHGSQLGALGNNGLWRGPCHCWEKIRFS